MLAEKRNFTIIRMVRLLEVSRSGYYAWAKHGPSTRLLRQERIEQKVAWFHGDSDEVAGSPKILMDLRDGGETISRKTVAKTMRKLGLVGVCPKRWKTTTIANMTDTYSIDVVQRKWDVGALNQIWVGDISYLRTWEGWLYLATVIDAHSRRVIGWAIDEHMRADCSTRTVRGTQYASDQITTFANENALTRSMGCTGVCWDNAMAESFFATLKTEFYYRGVWPTKKLARIKFGKLIEDRYDRRRRHASLGQISPVAFEMQYLTITAALKKAA